MKHANGFRPGDQYDGSLIAQVHEMPSGFTLTFADDTVTNVCRWCDATYESANSLGSHVKVHSPARRAKKAAAKKPPAKRAPESLADVLFEELNVLKHKAELFDRVCEMLDISEDDIEGI